MRVYTRRKRLFRFRKLLISRTKRMLTGSSKARSRCWRIIRWKLMKNSAKQLWLWTIMTTSRTLKSCKAKCHPKMVSQSCTSTLCWSRSTSRRLTTVIMCSTLSSFCMIRSKICTFCGLGGAGLGPSVNTRGHLSPLSWQPNLSSKRCSDKRAVINGSMSTHSSMCLKGTSSGGWVGRRSTWLPIWRNGKLLRAKSTLRKYSSTLLITCTWKSLTWTKQSSHS